MIVYRIESIHTGQGLYNHGHNWLDDGLSYEWDCEASYVHKMMLNDNSNLLERHPSPADDGIPDYTAEHFFGFASEEQMVNWLGEDGVENIRTGLLSDWFEIRRYEVDEEHVLFGNRQVCFIKDQAITI